MRSVKTRLLGLLAVAVLGVLGFASSAQAVTELASGFFVGGKEVGITKTAVEVEQVGRSTISVPSLKSELNCEKLSTVSSYINNTSDADDTLLFEECTVLATSPLEEAFGCEIVTNHEGGAQKHHVTAKALLLPAELQDGTPAVLLENISAKILTKPESGCVLPKTTEVKGEICLKVEKNHTTEPEGVASEEIQGLCNPRLTLGGAEVSGSKAELEKLESEGKAVLDKVLFGTSEAFVSGKMKFFLTGVFKGLTIGILLI